MPQAETPNPTSAQLRENRFAAVFNYPAALDEVVRRLRLNLNTEIAAMNVQEGWTGHEAIVPPSEVAGDKGVDWAGMPIADLPVNRVLVGLPSAVTDPLAPRVLKDDSSLAIFSLHPRIEIAQQWRSALRRVAAVQSVMFYFLDNVTDAQGRKCWLTLQSDGFQAMPNSYEKVGGFIIPFSMVQAPDPSQWAATRT